MEVYGQLQPNDAATDVIRARRHAVATSEPSGLAPRCRPHGSQDAATTPSEMRCRAAATGATRCATTTSAPTAGASAWCSPSCRCCRRTATRSGSSRRSVWTRSRRSLPERPRPSHEGDPILLDSVPVSTPGAASGAEVLILPRGRRCHGSRRSISRIQGGGHPLSRRGGGRGPCRPSIVGQARSCAKTCAPAPIQVGRKSTASNQHSHAYAARVRAPAAPLRRASASRSCPWWTWSSGATRA